jgi:hypothetical protein
MDSSAHTTAATTEIIIETACRADAWIRQRTEPLFTKKYSRKTMSLLIKKSSSKLLQEATLGFISALNPY